MKEEESCLRQVAKEGLNTAVLLKRASIQLREERNELGSELLQRVTGGMAL